MNIAGSNNIFTIKIYEEFDVTSMNVTKEITDASGIRTITYNEYNEASSENFNGDEINHLISETQASYGRNTGYSYSKASILQQSVNIGYGEEGRIATTSFLHEGIEQQFSYSYLEGSKLLHTLAHPNNILLSNTYEEQRNLITSMNITRGTANVVLRSYSYDALARPLSRSCSRRATSRNDSFAYNTRSELIQAELGSKHYAYSYDNIGNRKTAQELAEESTYEANQLNQYTDITQSETPFTPTFDADGNQTLIKTTTGIWSVSYNADNRPISFSQAQGDQSTIIECGYDYMGRRYTKKVTSNGTVSLHQRYIYRGYLQIACVDLTRSGHPALWYITWDPTEPVATRPLAIQKNATWYSYSHDLTKNVTELYQSDGLIATTYDYSPYGAATAEGIDQPLQWSSEYHDPELALTYYNYRHYNPTDGRWINRDPLGEMIGGFNLYGFVKNHLLFRTDHLGREDEDEDIILGYVYDPALEGADIMVDKSSTVAFNNKSIENDITKMAELGKAGAVKNMKAPSNLWAPEFNQKISTVIGTSPCKAAKLGIKLSPIADIVGLVGFSSKLEKVRFQQLVEAFNDHQLHNDSGSCLELFAAMLAYSNTLPGGGNDVFTITMYYSCIHECSNQL